MISARDKGTPEFPSIPVVRPKETWIRVYNVRHDYAPFRSHVIAHKISTEEIGSECMSSVLNFERQWGDMLQSVIKFQGFQNRSESRNWIISANVLFSK